MTKTILPHNITIDNLKAHRGDESNARSLRLALARIALYPTSDLQGADHQAEVENNRHLLHQLVDQLQPADLRALTVSAKVMYLFPDVSEGVRASLDQNRSFRGLLTTTADLPVI